MKDITQDKYVLGESQTKVIQNVGEEIRLDLSLVNNTNSLNGGKVTGTVTDANGNSIPNALIKIMSTTFEPLMHTVTSASGQYTFNSVAPGQSYNIFAIASGTKLQQGTQFTISQYQTLNVNFTLEADNAMTLGVIAGDLINSSTSSPVSGAVVSLFSVDATNVERIIGVTYTNANGQYTFREVGTGNYMVRISALGYNSVGASASVTQPGQIVPMTVSIVPNPSTSRGTVSGIITNSTNQPINRADVILYKVNANNSLTPVSFTKTNAAGVYLFANVPAGSYKVKSNQTEITSIDVNDPWTYSPDYDYFTIAYAGTYLPLSFSAADGTLSNGASLTLNDKFVTNLGGADGGAVTVNVSVGQAAKYTLGLKYIASGSDKTLKIDVNGTNTGETYTLAQTAGNNATDAQTFTTTLNLDSGVNTIKFYNTTDPGPTIGSFTLLAAPATVQVASTSGTLANGAVIVPGVTGYVGGIGDTGGTLTVTVTAPVAGTYNLGIQHINGNVRPLTINVNGVAGTQLSIPATAGWNQGDAQVYNTTVTLNKGSNSLILLNSPNDAAPWIGNLTFTQNLFSVKVEAESGTLTGAANIKNGVVSGIGYGLGSLTVTATVPTAEKYDMLIRYVSGVTNNVCNIDVNNVSTGVTYTFPTTGSWDVSSAANKYISLLLNAGANTLKFYNAQ